MEAMNPYMGDLFALRTQSPPPCTDIPCTSLHGSPPLPCTYITCISLCSLCSLCFHAWFPVWVPTTPMYLHSLHFPVFPVFPMFPCMVSCVGPHHSHVTTFPAWVTFLHLGHNPHHHVHTFPAFSHMGPHQSHVPRFLVFPAFPVFLCMVPCVGPTTPMGSIPCMCDLFVLKSTVTTTIYLHSLHFPV